MVTKGKYYNRNNTCDECKIEKLEPGNARREYDKNGTWTGRWLCEKCSGIYRQKLPNSQHNMMKSIANIRTNNLDPSTNTWKGYMFEQVTCKWRGIDSLNIEYDNFRSPIDHSRDPELGIVQTKGAYYNSEYRRWTNVVYNEHEKNFDNLIFYCTDKDMKNIKRVYIFPRREVICRRSISIYKNPDPSKSKFPWYEKYRVTDEDILKKINDIWHKVTK